MEGTARQSERRGEHGRLQHCFQHGINSPFLMRAGPIGARGTLTPAGRTPASPGASRGSLSAADGQTLTPRIFISTHLQPSPASSFMDSCADVSKD
jgi:hypothetical protein